MKKRYNGAVLITGASSGIGEAFARKFAEERYDLVLVARREERLRALQEELVAKFGVLVFICVVDLQDPRGCAAVFDFVQKNSIKIGVLVNNAGYGVVSDFGSETLTKELGMVDLNCRAVVELTHYFLPQLKTLKPSAMIIVSSVVGTFPTPYFATYAATKAFDLSFGVALTEELRSEGVDVLTVLPGLTKTEFHAGAGLRQKVGPYRDSSQVVETALTALGNRSFVTDGFSNAFLVNLLRLLPIGLAAKLVGYVMKKQISGAKNES